MTTAQQAINAATRFLLDLYASEPDRLSEIRVSEIEQTGNRNSDWLVTLEFLIEVSAEARKKSILGLLGTHRREYKVFRVEGRSGRVLSMKERTPFARGA